MFELLFKYSRDTFERGELVFASNWPMWLLFVAIAVGAGVSAFSLWRFRQDLGFAKAAVIGVLQTLVWAVLLTMAWRPALVSQTLRAQENSVALLVDDSASMGYTENGSTRLQQALQALEDDALPQLQNNFEINRYRFSSATSSVDAFDDVGASGTSTLIGDGLLDVLRSSNAGGLAAVVLVSDGADTSGNLDAARIAEIAGYGIPVHTVGVGREVLEEDIELEDVVMASQGPAGSTISAQVSIRHARGAQTQLKVYDGDAIIASESIVLPDRPGVTTRWVDLEVGEAGVRDLRFALDPVEGETNAINNTQLRPVEVPLTRRSILYIEGEPRWEYKFIRRAIDPEGALRVASLVSTTPNKDYRQGITSAEELDQGFPVDEETLFAYDAIILGSLEAASISEAQQDNLREFVSRRGGTLLMLGARRGLADGGWAATSVADVLPAQLPDLESLGGPSFFRETPTRAVLTDEGRRSLITRLEADEAANAAAWAEMPEMLEIQLLDDLKPGAVVLLEGRTATSTQPLLVHQRFGRGNAYIFATGDSWKWQMLLPHDDMRHETFWRQLMQAIAMSAAQRVTLSTQRSFYADESLVSLRAEVKDKLFEPTSDATVQVVVNHASGARETIDLNPVAGSPGIYAADYDATVQGIYRFEATASDSEGETLGSARVAVRREDGVAEHFRTQQNRALLERVSAATGGQYFELGDVEDLYDSVRFSEAGVVERQLLDLWNMPFNFLLLLLLKSTEWLVRLRWGRL